MTSNTMIITSKNDKAKLGAFKTYNLDIRIPGALVPVVDKFTKTFNRPVDSLFSLLISDQISAMEEDPEYAINILHGIMLQFHEQDINKDNINEK